MEHNSKKKSTSIEDANGNTFAEVIDLIQPEDIGEAHSDWKASGVYQGPDRKEYVKQLLAKRKAKKEGKKMDEQSNLGEGKKKGLWDNIHAKRKRGEKPAKKGDKDYPETLDIGEGTEQDGPDPTPKQRRGAINNIKQQRNLAKHDGDKNAEKLQKARAKAWGIKEGLTQARDNVGADKCWDGYKAKGTKKKGGKEVPNCVKEGKKTFSEFCESAWQRKEGKNKAGGLNEKGRKSYERENPGSDLKAPVTKEPSKLDPDSKSAKRRKSFCARMGGMPGPMKDEKGKPTRKALSLRKWNC